MESGRAEPSGPTLRSRLTFWNTAVLLLLVSVTLVGLRQALLWTMLGELDHLLHEDAQEVALLVRGKYPDHNLIREALDRKARSHREDGWFVEIYYPDGQLYVSSQPGVDAVPPVDVPVTALSRDGLRIVHLQLGEEGRPAMIARVGASLAGIDEDVNRLTRLLLVVGVVIVGVAPVAGWFLAGRAIRPLAAILRTTRRLRPDHLDERLTLRGTNDELDRLSLTINSFLDKLALHLRQQREFVANAAHELRSPLTALRSAIDVTLTRERSGADYRDLLADLAEECDSLRTLVNQLLLLAESDVGALARGATPQQLDDLVRRSVEMFEGVAEQREVELKVSALEPALVLGHPIHLREVIHNLLDNALNYTPRGGRVTVELSKVVTAGQGRAVLCVRDTGIGIAAEHLPHLFERFYRADRARERGAGKGGSGLGLCICQSIVTAYGGAIRVESAPEQGTAVHVELPAV